MHQWSLRFDLARAVGEPCGTTIEPEPTMTTASPHVSDQADRDGADPSGPGRYRPIVVLAVLAAISLGAIVLLLVAGDEPEATSTAAEAGATSAEADGSGGDGAIDVTQLVFVDPNGNEATLADFGGQPLVVNFFAAWCAPCRAELPDLEATHVAAGNDVQFVGVSHDIDQASWLSLVAETGITYPTFFQPEQEIFEALDLLGMPSTIFVGPDGVVVHTFTGVLDDDLLRQLMADHLSVSVSTPEGP
jgi:thiol-disulfide isomerase/thioredoxin